MKSGRPFASEYPPALSRYPPHRFATGSFPSGPVVLRPPILTIAGSASPRRSHFGNAGARTAATRSILARDGRSHVRIAGNRFGFRLLPELPEFRLFTFRLPGGKEGFGRGFPDCFFSRTGFAHLGLLVRFHPLLETLPSGRFQRAGESQTPSNSSYRGTKPGT